MRSRDILVVDPDEPTRALLVEFLHEEGFGVSAIAAVDQALDRRPGLVLLTIIRHELAVLDAMRARVPGTPIVVLTGLSARDLPDETLLQSGAAAVVRKPFGLDELGSTIELHLAPGGRDVLAYGD